jgi:putative transposase
MKTKNTYHTDLIIAYRLGAYDEEYFSHIPSSTRSNWKDRNIHNIIGCQKDIICTQNIKMVKTFLQKKKALKLAKAAYHIFRCYEIIVQKSDVLQNCIKTAKNEVVKVIDHIRSTVGFKKALDVFHVSAQQYHRWKASNRCIHSFFDVCFKTKPNQLTQSEVFTIKKYLNLPDLLSWPLASVYFKMMRDNAAFMSINTFYKYANTMIQNRLVAFRKRLRKKKYKGLKAFRVFQYIHMDVTVYKTTDNTKAFIYFIQDNYSKAILAWKISTRYCSRICMENLREAVDTFSLPKQNTRIICDGGIENKGEAENYLQSMSIEKCIAQKDIPYSNSLIEAFNKRIKYRFLFLQQLENIRQAENYLSKAIEIYNNQPLLVLNGYTPNEVLNGTNPGKKLFSQAIKASVKERIVQNTTNTCPVC